MDSTDPPAPASTTVVASPIPCAGCKDEHGNPRMVEAVATDPKSHDALDQSSTPPLASITWRCRFCGTARTVPVRLVEQGASR